MVNIQMSATSLPVCVQSGAVAIAAKVGCGQNIACGCHSTAFLAALQPLIYQSCPGPSDALAQAQSFCTAANPSLLDTRRNTIIIPVSIFLGLAIIAVALRFYARRLSKAVLGLDDWLAVGALVFGTVADILVLYGLSNGEATHQFMVSLDREIASNKSSIATGWVTLITILLLKLSILALYHRLFGHLRPFTIAIYIVGSLTAIQTTVNLFIFTFQCKPVAYFWDRAIPGGTCLNFQHIIIGQAASDLATGLTVLLMPAPILWTLHMSGVKRIAIAVVFVIGGFTCISGLLRIPFILAIDDYDIFWTLIPFSVFSCLEINIGYVSLPPCLAEISLAETASTTSTGLTVRSQGH